MNKAEIEGFSTNDIPDKEIIDRILQGEKECYSMIVRRYNQRLYRIGMAVVNDDAEVEDIMQVTYINAYQNLKKFAFKSSFSTWLTRIMVHESLLRIKKRRKHINIGEGIKNNEISPKYMIEKQSAAAKVLNAELNLALERAIQSLPEIYRTVFIMREVEKMSVAETKECLDISETNVKVRLNRAKVLLRQSLVSFYQNEEILGYHLSRCNRMRETVMRQIEQL